MRTRREGVLSSLVTRLTLAVLAVLVLSLGVTTVVFVGQSQAMNRGAAFRTLRQETRTVRTSVCKSLLNATDLRRPLAKVGSLTALGIDRVLLTTWPDSAVIGDTSYRGGAPSRGPTFAVQYHGRLRVTGEGQFDGVDYAYLAVPALVALPNCDPPNLSASTPAFRDVVLLVRLASLPDLTWGVVTKLAVPGAIAVLISSLAAFLVLRAMTRPLHGMMTASEHMAAGDYDQRVAGADSSDEIGQLARSFNRMAHEVKRARELQRQFVANVSHDLRSPLTSIIGFSQALTEDDAITPQQRRIAEIIHSDAARLNRLTMDLLDLSRLEAGHLPLSKRPLDLNALLRDIVTRYEALPNRRGVAFSADLATEPLPVVGDPDRLTQIVVNLLDNALKFCNAGGQVRLTSSRQQGIAVVEVYNTGAGIAPDDLPRVFDRFYRTDHSRAQQTGGSGIGLAIVRELVHAHGGEVTAASQLGAWAAMTMRLPLATTQFTEDLHLANMGATSKSV